MISHKISVVIPTYRRPGELKRAIDSVIAQDYPVMEILVVDDNPADSKERIDTKEVISGFNNSVTYHANDHSLGGGGARNVGIKMASGDYVAFLDDDDEWLPGKLSKQMALWETLPENVACIDTGFYEINETTGIEKTVYPVLHGDIFEALLVKDKGRAPKLSTLICKRNALIDAGMFDPELPSRQDLDLYLRLARNYRFEFVHETLAKKYVHDSERISSSYTNKIGGFDLLYKKYKADLVARPRLHRIYLRQHAKWLLKGRRYLPAIGKVLKSLFV